MAARTEIKNKGTKLLIAGVGGQGVVFLTNLIAEAARVAAKPVHVSEIHGLSQRGGVVTAGIGIGKNTSGFLAAGGVDFLLGLEPLETQRCLEYLNPDSCVIFSDYHIPPYSVNAELAEYPEAGKLLDFLKKSCRQVVFINEFPEGINSVLYNIFLLGRATKISGFPLTAHELEAAMNASLDEKRLPSTIEIFRKGST